MSDRWNRTRHVPHTTQSTSIQYTSIELLRTPGLTELFYWDLKWHALFAMPGFTQCCGVEQESADSLLWPWPTCTVLTLLVVDSNMYPTKQPHHRLCHG